MKYGVFIEREVHEARHRIPGHFRQRIRAAITGLADDPRPTGSRLLDTSELEVPAGVELRRLRMDPWRLVYAVHDEEGWVWILAVRRRPPYDYKDLIELLGRIEQR